MNESLEGLRVLIVEDEALLADELCLRLSRLGLKPLATVDTGDKAVKAALSLKPDLILMDIRLKGPMDGVQATEIITTATSIPTVFLTAHSDTETVQRAKGAQPYGYVLKPYNERDLIVTLEMALLRHRLHRRLTASERRFSATLASIDDGVIAIGPDGLITYVNPVAEELTGWSVEQARDRPIEEVFQLLDEQTGEPRENLLTIALQASSPIRTNGPALLRNRDGEKIPIEASAAPIRDEDSSGNLGAVLAVQDIRARRQADERLKRTKQQLQLAQRMEAIVQLSGGLAHDFNNLLTIICCHAELLLIEEDLSPTSRELVDEIQRAGRQGSTITRQLLSFSRQQVVQHNPLSLQEVMEEVGKVLNRLLGGGICLQVTCEEGLHQISADPRQIEQIILNLAINARDAMPSGGTLELSAKNVVAKLSSEEERQEVKLSITDTGTGIPQEQLDKIFEPLFTTKEAGVGSGLGLTTVKSIVEQSDGRIEVTSRLGEGTCFTLYFPALIKKETALPKTNDEEPQSSTADAQPSSGTVLVVDDQAAVRASISAILKKRGYGVLTAESGREAEQIAREALDSILLVVTDMEMPQLNGRELACKLRSLNPKIKLLFLSAHTRESLLGRNLLQDTDPFLQKPFGMSQFTSKVRELTEEYTAG